jgi:hypothetical protein
MKFSIRNAPVTLALVTLAACTAAYAQRVCAVPFPFPRLPIQANFYLPAVAAAQNATAPTKVQVTPLTAITPPRDRFLLIDSIAFKGTHPSNTYLAIELRTTTSASQPAAPGQSPGPPLVGQQVWTRHFLYAKANQAESSALSFRESLSIYSAPGMPVYLGVQSSAGSSLEQIDLTITGFWVDACRWGQ